MDKIERIKGSILNGTPSEIKIVSKTIFDRTVEDIKNISNDCIHSPKYDCYIGTISFDMNSINFRSTGYHRKGDFVTRFGFSINKKSYNDRIYQKNQLK